MNAVESLMDVMPEGQTVGVTIGLHWTAVVAGVGGQTRCGLASTLREVLPHGDVDVPYAGTLERLPAKELANLATAGNAILRSIGFAAINALLPPLPDRWVDGNAEDVIAAAGAGKTVVLVGHFPFIASLRRRVGRLIVLEQSPGPGELPASAAAELVPQAAVLAMTSMTLLNGTFGGLMALRAPAARVLLLGPSTPLHPLLFDFGVEMLSGSYVTDIEPVRHVISQGGVFRQVHKAGVRLVTISAS